MSETNGTALAPAEVFDFDDVAPQMMKVKYQNKWYLLCEADEDASIAYRDKATSGLSFNDGKLAKVDRLGEIQVLLVSRCLYQLNQETMKVEYTGPRGDIPVKVSPIVLRSWPSQFVKRMFDWVKRVSRLDEADTEEQLEKQIKEMQARLAKMREGKDRPEGAEGIGDPKLLSAATGDS